MPEVNIYNILEPSKSQKVEYDFGDESLQEIVEKYDINASTWTCRLAIGEEVFLDWDIPIEACLEYGDSIFLYFYPPPKRSVIIMTNILEIIKYNFEKFGKNGKFLSNIFIMVIIIRFFSNYRSHIRPHLKDFMLM